MTLLDDRPGPAARRPASVFAEATELVDRMLATLAPDPAAPVANVLFAEVTRLYRRVLEERRGVVAAERSRLRAAGQAFVAAGGEPDTVAEMLGRLASHLIGVVAGRRPELVVSLVDVAHLVVREFLAGASEPAGTVERTGRLRWNLVQRLVLAGEVPPRIASTLAADYVVAVLRFPEPVPQDRLMPLIEEHSAEGILSAPVEEGVIVLVPERAEGVLSPLVSKCDAILGVSPWLSTAGSRPRAEIAAGYQEAKDVLALAVATRQPPGRYRLDDFLVEHAIVSDPLVSRHLTRVIEPLMGNEVLRETLEVLIRHDFNRSAAARDLFVHRSTLDYRIRRIEEITGHGPMSIRGAYILRVAMAAHAMAEATG